MLFSDLAGFTALSEKLTPADQVSLLNEYLGGAADAVTERQGMVDKIREVVRRRPKLAALACSAAIRFVELTGDLKPICDRLGVPPLHVRVGVATGVVLVGVIGSASSRQNYTVMGDTANLGSRLEGVNKLYSTQVLVDQPTRDAAGDRFLYRRIDRVRVVGRDEPVQLHEVVGEHDRVDDDTLARCDTYAAALALYESRDWPAANDAFNAVNQSWPDDETAARMALRCYAFANEDPGPYWDGVFKLDAK